MIKIDPYILSCIRREIIKVSYFDVGVGLIRSLSPEKVEALICSQNWLQSIYCKKPFDLRALMNEVEGYEDDAGNILTSI